MTFTSAFLAFVALQLPASPEVDTTRLAHANGIPVPIVRAVRAERPPVIDGHLDDEAWSSAPLITEFWQRNPKEGEPATQRTEVRILYDNDALYVGARLYESDPSVIRAELTRRDAGSSSDLFTVDLDTYHDHQTSMRFFVNPLGVRGDGITSNDQDYADRSWDPVWLAATQRDSLGWNAEMRIPLSQLRFPPRAHQVWGVNFYRYSQSRQESAAFVLVRQNEQGTASRFAHLVGISDVPAPRRVELAPYARASLETRRPVPGDPFFDGSELTSGYGLDLKYGVTSNLTLDATFNPDFGQVEADPAELNLSVFETFFSERRPFFLEGAQIFNFGGCSGFCFSFQPDFFYSRRIGRSPTLFPSAERAFRMGTVTRGPFMDVPASTPILGAAKLTGKLPSGTSIGLLHAETGDVHGMVHAEVETDGGEVTLRYRDQIEPAGHHSIARLRQDFRGGATTLGIILTHVARDLDTPALQARLNDRALAGGLDWQHRWRQNRFNFRGQVGWSTIHGSPEAITRAQTSSARYYQRPDIDYVELDPTRTSLSGYTGGAGLTYNASSGFNFGLSASTVSPGFEINDAGIMFSADNRTGGVHVGWQRPKPGRIVRFQGFDAYVAQDWNSGWTPIGGSGGAGGFIGLQNNWHGSVFMNYSPEALSATLTRGGPLMTRPAQRSINVFLGTDDRKQVSASGFTFLQRTEAGGRRLSGNISVNWRPATHVQLTLGPNASMSRTDAFYAAAVTDPGATATFGRRYIFAQSEQRSLGVTTRLNYTFTPDLTFQLYMQPFTASAAYTGFKELRRPRSYEFLRYGVDDGSTIAPETAEPGCEQQGACYRVDPDGAAGATSSFVLANPDIAFRSLRGTAVLRWEYLPGATVFAVWTQRRSDSDRSGEFGGVRDIPDLFSLPAENVFLLKASYWFSR